MARAKPVSDDAFIRAVQSSTSIRSLLKRLGLQPTGGNYDVAKRRINRLGLDTSHFLGQGYLKGRTHNWAKAIPLEQILVENSDYGGGTFVLKKRLIKAGYFTEKCYRCNLREWQGLPIPTHLEHINGDRYDNRIENLILLCPNCHALTDTSPVKINGGGTERHQKLNRVESRPFPLLTNL
jgi:hypothetical protein